MDQCDRTINDHKMNIQTAVNSPRMHHQWWPDIIRTEQGISPDTIKILKDMGHKVSQKSAMGGSQSILVDDQNGILYGAADPRQSTSKASGF